MFYLLKYVHVLGATVLLGTGAGIAFFMLMAHRTGDVAIIAGVARIVVMPLKNSAARHLQLGQRFSAL
jgi:uncharacterized membrane protein